MDRQAYQGAMFEETGEVKPLTKLSFAPNTFARFTTPKTKATHEYQDIVSRAAKICGQKYIAMHRRVEQAFLNHSPDFVIGLLNRWLCEAEKDNNPGLCFNARFKRFRESKV